MAGTQPTPAYKPSPTKWLAMLLAVFTAVLLWKLRNIQQIADSLGIAYDVRAGKDLFNPHHLLFGPSVRLVYNALHLMGVNVDAITAAQLHNIGWSVVAVVGFFFIVYHITNKYGFAVVGALSLLFAHTYWQFSTQSEVYVAATGPIMIMLTALLYYPDKRTTLKMFVAMLLLLFLSICYHQLGVFLLVPLWVYFYMEHGKKGLRFMAAFTLASGLITMFAYTGVYASKGQGFTVNGFIHYCLEYAYLNPDWGTMAHLKSGGEWMKIFTNQAAAFLPEWRIANVPAKIIVASFAVLWLWNIAAAVRRTNHYQLRTFALVWLGAFYLFLVWWTAGYEFFVLTIPPTLLLLLFMLHDISRWLGRYRQFESVWVQEAYYLFVPLLVLIIMVRLNIPSFVKYHREHDIGYLQAERAKQLCRNCKIVTNFNVMTNLAYHQNYLNAVESDGLYIAYYYKDSVPQKYELRNDSCILMEVWYLNPWYNSLEKTGFDLPQKYTKVIEHTFDIKPDGKHWTCRQFTVIPNSVGDYISIGPGRIDLKDYEQLFRSLDDSIRSKGVKNQAAFVQWYRENSGKK